MTAHSNTLLKYSAVFFLLLISSVISAKDHYVYGSVVDNFHNQPIPGMNVILLRTDSAMVSACIVEERPYDTPPRTVFTLSVKEEGKYILRFSMLGYQTTYADIDVKFKKNSSVVEVGKYEIKEKVYKLKETTVVASKIKMVMKGDTIVYNAGAFQLAEGSMLDALVSQLPGVELKDDGRIYANGKFVKNLLLNGKDFFKGDPKVALDNLPSYMVDKVKVYDKAGKMSEFMNRDMGDKELVMDVHLKKQYSIGWIANADLGAGTEERYMARLFGLRFTANSRLTLFANMNNLNNNRRPGRNGDWRPSDMPTGLQTTQVGGLSYSLETRGENKMNFDTDNKVEHYDANTTVNNSSVTFLPLGDVFNRSYNWSRNKQTIYRSYTSLYYKQPKYWLSISERLYYRTSNGLESGRLGSFSSNPSNLVSGNLLDSLFMPNMGNVLKQILVNRQQHESMDDGNYLSSNTRLGTLLNLNDNLLVIDGNFQYERGENNTFLKRNIDYFSSSEISSSDYRSQYFNQPNSRHRYIINARYDYHIARNVGIDEVNIMLAPYYTFDDDYKSSNRFLYRLDQLPEWEAEDKSQPLGTLPSATDALQTVIDQRNSYESEVHEIQHTLRLRLLVTNLKRGSNKINFELNLTADALKQKMDYYRNDTYYPLTRNSFLPRPDARITIYKKNGQIEWNYRMRSQPPTLTYLLNIRDDSDPLNISLGNTDLRDTHTHSTNISYSHNNRKIQGNLFANVSFNYIKHAIAMGLTYDRTTGVRTYRPDNVNGNYTLNGNINYGCALDKKQQWYFYTSTGASYNHNVDFVGAGNATQSLRSVVNNLYLNETLKVDYRLGSKFSIGAKAIGNWTHSTSKRDDFHTIDAGDFNYGLTGQVELPWKMQLSTDLTMYSRRGYEDPEMNKDEFVWNARLSKSCMKGNLTFMLDGFDLLGNLSNVHRTLNAQGRTESYYNVIPSYAMLHVVYKLNIQPKKKKELKFPKCGSYTSER